MSGKSVSRSPLSAIPGAAAVTEAPKSPKLKLKALAKLRSPPHAFLVAERAAWPRSRRSNADLICGTSTESRDRFSGTSSLIHAKPAVSALRVSSSKQDGLTNTSQPDEYMMLGRASQAHPVERDPDSFDDRTTAGKLVRFGAGTRSVGIATRVHL